MSDQPPRKIVAFQWVDGHDGPETTLFVLDDRGDLWEWVSPDGGPGYWQQFVVHALPEREGDDA